MKHKRIWQRLTSGQWAITQDALDEILSIAQRQNLSPEAVAAQLGRDLDNSYDVQVREGVAILPVKGPLFRYANVFTAISGATSYQMLALDLQRVVEDDSIRAVLLDVDSPGGETNGNIELAEMIHAARSRKPVWAYVGGQGASAAYVLAAAASRVVVADAAIIGSVGTVASIIDRSGADEKAGIKRYEIVSSQSPHKRLDPGTKEGEARIQSLVDALSDVMIDRIAMFRAVSRDDVLSDFGQGDVMLGAAAVAAGMADGVGSFESVLADLVATGQDRTDSRILGGGAAGARSEGVAMKDGKTTPAGGTQSGMTDDELLAKGKAEGEEKDREDEETKGKSKGKGKAAEGDEDEEEEEPAGKKKSKSKSKAKGKGKAADEDDDETDAEDDEEEDGAKASAERTRIKAILTHAEAKGRADLAQHLAFETDMTVEAAATLLARSPKAEAKGSPEFIAAMQATANPDVSADGEGGGGGGDESATAVQSIVAAARAAGDSRY